MGLVTLLLLDRTAVIRAARSSLSLMNDLLRPARPRGFISAIGAGGNRKPIRWAWAARVSREKSFLCFTKAPTLFDRPEVFGAAPIPTNLSVFTDVSDASVKDLDGFDRLYSGADFEVFLSRSAATPGITVRNVNKALGKCP